MNPGKNSNSKKHTIRGKGIVFVSQLCTAKCKIQNINKNLTSYQR